MKIAITGATGLVGSALCEKLTSRCHELVKISRDIRKGDIAWDPSTGIRNLDKLEGCDAFVHLAGENIGDGRWTPAKKKALRDSRVEGTQSVVDSIRKLSSPPITFIAASAIGYYGDRGDDLLDENSSMGSGFLPELCDEWEAQSRPLADMDFRYANIRIGVVLSGQGGALKKMLLPFQFGLGGVIGTGNQWMSWIALDDLVDIFVWAIENDSVHGTINATSTGATTNREFTKAMGKVLGRPTFMPMPAFAARAAFGEMADALLLTGARVYPKYLMDAGYKLRHPNIVGALQHELTKETD